MAEIQMRPLTVADITPGAPLVMVMVKEFFDHGRAPNRIGNNGTFVAILQDEPVRADPRFPGKRFVYYNIPANANRAWRVGGTEYSEMLRDEYDVADNDLSVRFFVRLLG